MRRVLFVFFFLAIPLAYFIGVSVQQQFDTSSSMMLMEGAKYTLQKDPSIDSEISLQDIPGGTAISIIELKNDWAMLEVAEQKGWIPRWYLVTKDSNMRLEAINSDYMVVKDDYQGVLYPNGPSILELTQGSLVQPLLRWNKWIKVSLIQFSIPGISEIWVEEKVLAPVSEIEPKQGYLRKGSQTFEVLDYYEIFLVKPEEAAYSMPVSIEEKHGDFSYVFAPGGWYGWVKSKDISYSRFNK